MLRQYRKTKKWAGNAKRNLLAVSPLLRKLSLAQKKGWNLKTGYLGRIDEKLVIFKSNNGIDFSGMPALVYKAMEKDSRYQDYKYAWLFKDKKNFHQFNNFPNTKIFEAVSKKGIQVLSTAHYLVCNTELYDFEKLKPGQVLIFDPEEYYGAALEGKDISVFENGRYQLKNALHYADYIFAANTAHKEILSTLCKKFGNRKAKIVINFPSMQEYLYDDGNRKELLEFEPPKDKIKALLALKERTICSVSWLNQWWHPVLFIFQNINFLTYDSTKTIEAVENEKAENYIYEKMYDITDIIKKNPEEKKWYANYEAQNIIPPYIGRKQQFLTCDIVITDCVRFLQEAILLGKKVIWLEDSLLRQNPLEQKAFTNFIKTHGEIPKSDISHLPETAAKTTEAKQDIMLPEREMWKQQKDICLPELIFDKNPDSVHGILKVINFAPYDWDMRKSLPFITMKNMVKAIDIELLKIFYSFTGFFRSMGLSTGTNAKELHSYKNRHRGQRCFLIGNGPSLTIGDLELLHNEVTFGCNRLYKMFEKTNWRPTYYCMIDALIAKYSSRDLAETVECPMFTNIHTKDLMKYPPKHLVFARNLGAKHYRVSPHFESYYVPSGATVMTFMLELAMYMGFTEIYLLGVDCTSSLSSSGHCVKGYFNEEMIKKDVERIRRRLNNPSLTAEQVADYYFRQSTSSYTLIREYADKHGFHIYNATRGGMLEAFERRNLDEVVKSI